MSKKVKDKQKVSNKDIFLSGIFKQNAVFTLTLGLCPALAISNTVEGALGMGIMVVIVLAITNAIISMLRKVISDEIRIPAYILIIATVVTMMKMFVDAYAAALASSLGVFIALITVNCIVLGRAEAFAKDNSVGKSILDGLGSGLGFMLALLLIAVFREALGTGAIKLGVLLPLPFEVTLRLFPSEYGISMLIQPMGAYLIIGVLLATFVAYDNNKKYRAGIKRAKELQARKAAAE
ncbi:MAG TPA: electron transport complex subunit RsxE [Acholeplasma sp.]|jgi:electron transport complex protein RnfE|nr:electron transport complex subunit RsxE [Acholeplasma sp.]